MEKVGLAHSLFGVALLEAHQIGLWHLEGRVIVGRVFRPWRGSTGRGSEKRWMLWMLNMEDEESGLPNTNVT